MSTLKIDEVKEFIWVALRSQERFSSNLKAIVDGLDKIKDGDEWLLQIQEEVGKGSSFCEAQHRLWQGFGSRVDDYIMTVRKEADELAIRELQIEKKETVDAGSGSAKTLHPELTKFKLEKQARILGKYGGVPAMGAGMVMQLPPRDNILKATASPAAREIQYSKVEGKDAQNLAEVMQFHARRRTGGSENGGGDGTTPGGGSKVQRGDELAAETSPWQAEMLERKGKEYFKQRQQSEEEAAAAAALSRMPVSDELGGVLKGRQELLSKAEAEATLAARHHSSGADPSTPKIGSEATSELAAKLQRQQVSLKASEEALAAETPEAVVSSSRWSNTSVPFGAELSAALRQRSANKAQQDSASYAQSVSPGFSFRTASSAIGNAGADPGSFTPPTLRRPPAGAAATPFTSAASPAASGANELAEALRARQERQQQAGLEGR